MLDDFRTRFGDCATIQNAALGQFAHGVWPRHPPLRTFAARLIKLQHAVGLCPAEIKRDSPPGNDWPSTVVHLAARFVLIEAQMNKAAQVVA